MEKANKDKDSGDVDLRQIDDEVLDIYKTDRIDFPIIERTTNALIWPEEIKGGIDLEDTDSVTQVPVNPDTPLDYLNIKK